MFVLFTCKITKSIKKFLLFFFFFNKDMMNLCQSVAI